MKPDNKKRRSKKRRPDGYRGGRERKRMVNAKGLKRNVKKVGKRMGRHAKAYPECGRLKTVTMLGIMVRRYGFPPRG